MSQSKRRAPRTAIRGLVDGIMRAVEKYNAEMGLEGPRMPQDETRGVGSTERPARRHEGQEAGQPQS